MTIKPEELCLKCRDWTGSQTDLTYGCRDIDFCPALERDTDFERRERAAILEFEAGLTRVEAERKAGLKG